jgi:hypothetical protein
MKLNSIGERYIKHIEYDHLDELDDKIINKVREHDEGIPITELYKNGFTDIPMISFRQRVKSLHNLGKIATLKQRNLIYLYPVLP